MTARKQRPLARGKAVPKLSNWPMGKGRQWRFRYSPGCGDKSSVRRQSRIFRMRGELHIQPRFGGKAGAGSFLLELMLIAARLGAELPWFASRVALNAEGAPAPNQDAVAVRSRPRHPSTQYATRLAIAAALLILNMPTGLIPPSCPRCWASPWVESSWTCRVPWPVGRRMPACLAPGSPPRAADR